MTPSTIAPEALSGIHGGFLYQDKGHGLSECQTVGAGWLSCTPLDPQWKNKFMVYDVAPRQVVR